MNQIEQAYTAKSLAAVIKSLKQDWQKDGAIRAIAHDILDIETLAERRRDSLDFHEVSVWQVRDALLAAYAAGFTAAKNGGAA